MAGYIGNKAAFLSSTSGADIDGNVTIDGDLTVSGNTVTIDSAQAQEIRLGDNDKMTFGDATGGDLQIYHDGYNSFIKDAGTGYLVIQANAIGFANASNSENLAFFQQDGAASLHYDGSTKLATTSTGVDITGTLTSDDAVIAGSETSFQSRVSVTPADNQNRTLTITEQKLTFSAPSSFGTSYDTFISSAPSYLTFGTSNAEAMRITSDGNVGIGTTLPATSSGYTSLAINGTTSGWIQLMDDGINVADWYSSGGTESTLRSLNGGFNFTVSGASDIKFNINSSERMRIGSNGNVVIGGTPAASDARLTLMHTDPALFFHDTSAGQQDGAIQVSNGTMLFLNGANTNNVSGLSERMRISSGGNVGIGTSSPDNKLTVRDTNVIIDAQSSADSQTVGLRAGYQNHGTLAGFFRYSTGDAQLYIDNTFAGNNGVYSDINFRNCPNGSNSLTPRMKIKGSNGRVGINTTNPSSQLHVEGDFRVGQQNFREGYTSVNSSETRWYKVIQYTGTAMFIGRAFITVNRFGGYNQTGAYKEYKASVGGYANAIYGPFNTTGDTGEGGVGSFEWGSDECLYLRVNSSIYGGTLYFYLQGYINNWQFDNTSYSTSLP